MIIFVGKSTCHENKPRNILQEYRYALIFYWCNKRF